MTEKNKDIPAVSMSFKQALFNRRMLICLFNGASAGLPLFYIYHLIPAWLRSEDVDLKTIGLFALVGIPYNWKFLWAPLLDRYRPPFLGLRRGWMLITQLACMLSMFFMAFLQPATSIGWVAYGAAALAFFSASQDIVLDAYRRELLSDRELGLGNSMYMNGYRAMAFIPGGLGLILADLMPWTWVHIIIGSFMLIGVIKTLLVAEVSRATYRPKSLRESVIEPLSEFFSRQGVQPALLIIAFLFLYKLGDNMATALSTPFYLDVGFSKTVIGTTVKLVNFWSMLVGSFIGGLGIYRYGINRCLWIFGVVQMTSIFGFAILNEAGPVHWILATVIAYEYLGVGLGASALTAFMARTTSMNFTATQFALFSSLIALPRTFANATTGFLIEGISDKDGWLFSIFGTVSGLGYTRFFILCGLLALPGMALLYWVAPWGQDNASTQSVSN
jgi:MFS transporter, PAT family, beta-lactamase induction signal transducer AmpG